MASPEDNAFSLNPSREEKDKETTSFSFNLEEKIPSKPQKEPAEDSNSEQSFDSLKPTWGSYSLGTEKDISPENEKEGEKESEKEIAEDNFLMAEEISSEETYDPDKPYAEQYPPEKAQEGSEEEGAENQEGVNEVLEAMEKDVDEKLDQKEKEGWRSGWRRFGEWWKEGPVPVWAKRGLSAALVGGSLLATATGVGAVVLPGLALASGALRVLSGSAMYATIEGAFEKHAKNAGEGTDTRSTAKKNFHTLLAAGGGVLFGGLIGRLFDGFDGFDGSSLGAETANMAAGDTDVAESIIATSDGTIAEASVETSPGAAAPITPESGILGDTSQIEIKPGDTVWDIIKEKLSGQSTFDAMGVEQQTHVVDALKDRVEAMNPGQLQAIGIESGDPDMIFPEKTLDLSSVLNDGNVNTAYQDALNLSQGEIDSIAQNLQNK